MSRILYRLFFVFFSAAVLSLMCESEAVGQVNASSLWLNYTMNPADANADMVMIDFAVDSTALYTYYAGLVWGNGYAGIQCGGDSFYKNVHFSIWDPPNGTSNVVWHAPDVVVARFGGEGTGWKSDWGFNWEDNQTYRLLIKDVMTDTGSDYDAWFFDFQKYQWKHLATFEYPIPGPITSLSSFIEAFVNSPQNYRAYSLFNVWERLYPSKVWYPIRSAKYSINGADTNCDGRVDNNRFYLATGGTITPTNPTGTTLTIVPTTKVATENPEFKDVGIKWSSSDTIDIEWSYVNNLWAPQETYRIRVATDSGFSNIVYDSGRILSTDTVDEVSGTTLDSTQTYYLRIGSRTVFDDSTLETVEFRGSVVTGVKSEVDRLPTIFKLGQNYPNPFNPTTSIRYELPERSLVTLNVYDILGRKVETLVNGTEYAGSHDVNFSAAGLASGMYFYRLTTSAGFTEVRKMAIVK